MRAAAPTVLIEPSRPAAAVRADPRQAGANQRKTSRRLPIRGSAA